jgi:hypothetical protein
MAKVKNVKKRIWIERFLIVAGASGTGKSTQLRSMFLDPRLGSNSVIPTARNIPDIYKLSPYRSLYLRLTSPHEMRESMDEFFDKIEKKTKSGRWCVASAIQIDAKNKMPGLIAVVKNIESRFDPEIIRVAILSPDRKNKKLLDIAKLLNDLHQKTTCEVMVIDARQKTANGLLLFDTFDFS